MNKIDFVDKTYLSSPTLIPQWFTHSGCYDGLGPLESVVQPFTETFI